MPSRARNLRPSGNLVATLQPMMFRSTVTLIVLNTRLDDDSRRAAAEALGEFGDDGAANHGVRRGNSRAWRCEAWRGNFSAATTRMHLMSFCGWTRREHRSEPQRARHGAAD